MPEDSRVIYAILAAQLADLRERIAGSEMFDRLIGCTDLLGALAAQLPPGGGAAAAATRLETALDELAFHHAQHQDLARQTAELVARALRHLAAGELSLNGLSALYVSDHQRRLHEAVRAELARPSQSNHGAAPG